MTLDEVKAIVEQAKESSLVQIDKSEPLMSLVMINDEGVNHGVMQMYYKILAAVYEAELKEIRKEVK